MKKIHVLIPSLVATASMLLIGLVGCGDPTPPEPILPTDITLNETSITLNRDQTFILEATIWPEGTTCDLFWTSSLKSVATVDNGVVTAVGPGNATITVQALGYEGVEATCSVYVNPDPIDPIKIELNEETLVLDQDGSFELKATVYPEGATCDLVWTSTQEGVATVDNGLVAAVSPGNTIITVQAVGFDDVKASCKVHINTLDPDDPEAVILPPSIKVQLSSGGYAIVARIEPEDFSGQLEWTISDESVATVWSVYSDKYATVHPLKLGVVILTVKMVDYPNVYDTCEVHVVP